MLKRGAIEVNDYGLENVIVTGVHVVTGRAARGAD
jgi:hypothetical protein